MGLSRDNHSMFTRLSTCNMGLRAGQGGTPKSEQAGQQYLAKAREQGVHHPGGRLTPEALEAELEKYHALPPVSAVTRN